MKTSLLLISSVFSVLCLTACSEKPKTIDFYLNNDDARAEKVKWCKQSADRKKTTDCVNARTARAKIKLAENLGKPKPTSSSE